MESPGTGALMENLIGETTSPMAQYANTSPSNPRSRRKEIELENVFVSLGKRIFAQMNILVMFVNTLTAVFSISASVSLIRKEATAMYNFCDEGWPLYLEVQCPYTSSAAFISLLTIWILYFATMFIYKFSGTYDYWSNDLRFYLAHDILQNEWFMFVLVILGMVLTVGSAFTAVGYVIHNGTTASIGSILVFLCVNLYNLFKMAGGDIPALKVLSMARDFPDPVGINLNAAVEVHRKRCSATGHPQPKAVDSIFANHRDVLDYVQLCILQKHLQGDGSALDQLGDSSQLEEIVSRLLQPKL